MCRDNWGTHTNIGNGMASPATNTLMFATNSVERVRIDSSGRVLVGATSHNVIHNNNANAAGDSTTPLLYAEGTGDSKSLTIVSNNTNAWRGSVLGLARTRGTSVGDNTIIADGDNIGQIVFSAADGTDIRSNCASIRADIDATPGANDTPGRLVFSTTADGAVNPTERLRITSGGNLLVGATSSTGQTKWLFRNDAAGGADGCRLTVYNASNNSVNNQARLSLKTAHSETTFSSYNQGEVYISNPNAASYFMLYLGGSNRLNVQNAGHMLPGATNAQDLGSSSKRWRNLYTQDLKLSNEETNGNDVDGTWGNYTIQEGESDLFLINNRSGKKYKFNLTEVS